MAEMRSFGRVTVILGQQNGKYPYGNSILTEDHVTALIDPSLLLHLRKLMREGRVERDRERYLRS